MNIWHEIGIIIVSILLVVGLTLLIYDMQDNEGSLIGYAVFNDSVNDSDSVVEAEVVEVEVTKEMAEEAIEMAERIIGEMSGEGLSVVYVSDSLIEARKVFEQNEYVDILENLESSEAQKSEARLALRLVNWRDLDYSVVLFYTEEITERRDEAFLLNDKFSVEDSNLEDFEVSEGSLDILNRAKTAFAEERYEETEELLLEYQEAYEEEVSEHSTFAGIERGARNFFQRYWLFILIFLILLSVAAYFGYKKVEKKRLRKRIRKMRTERIGLVKLMKKAQTERFKHNVISGLVYNIRMKMYEEKVQRIREELPVLEERLKIKVKKKERVRGKRLTKSHEKGLKS
jgi:hypothetical protein